MKINALELKEKTRVFFGLSRMSHAVLDTAHPAIGALLVLGSFPSPFVSLVGLLAAVSGFLSVFSLNDVMDHPVDRERMEKYQRDFSSFDIDTLGYRHPIAQGKLRYRTALIWTLFWTFLSLCLAYSLNPLCALILVAAIGLEVSYCRLLRITHWKAWLSGIMVGVGALAGIYAVQPYPPSAYVLSFFFWAFAWEIGGRNIPNDWTDLEEDLRLGIRTTPVRYGRHRSSKMSFVLLILTVLSGLPLSIFGQLKHSILYQAGALLVGWIFLIKPGWQWMRDQRVESAMALFNRACLYPLAMLIIVILSIL